MLVTIFNDKIPYRVIFLQLLKVLEWNQQYQGTISVRFIFGGHKVAIYQRTITQNIFTILQITRTLLSDTFH